jgi:glutamine synthetase
MIQPLTGTTAEKHDAFFGKHRYDGLESFEKIWVELNWLLQQNQIFFFSKWRIRNTFEARGYTAWDPTSPAFILVLHYVFLFLFLILEKL